MVQQRETEKRRQKAEQERLAKVEELNRKYEEGCQQRQAEQKKKTERKIAQLEAPWAEEDRQKKDAEKIERQRQEEEQKRQDEDRKIRKEIEKKRQVEQKKQEAGRRRCEELERQRKQTKAARIAALPESQLTIAIEESDLDKVESLLKVHSLKYFETYGKKNKPEVLTYLLDNYYQNEDLYPLFLSSISNHANDTFDLLLEKLKEQDNLPSAGGIDTANWNNNRRAFFKLVQNGITPNKQYCLPDMTSIQDLNNTNNDRTQFLSMFLALTNPKLIRMRTAFAPEGGPEADQAVAAGQRYQKHPVIKAVYAFRKTLLDQRSQDLRNSLHQDLPSLPVDIHTIVSEYENSPDITIVPSESFEEFSTKLDNIIKN